MLLWVHMNGPEEKMIWKGKFSVFRKCVHCAMCNISRCWGIHWARIGIWCVSFCQFVCKYFNVVCTIGLSVEIFRDLLGPVLAFKTLNVLEQVPRRLCCRLNQTSSELLKLTVGQCEKGSFSSFNWFCLNVGWGGGTWPTCPHVGYEAEFRRRAILSCALFCSIGLTSSSILCRFLINSSLAFWRPIFTDYGYLVVLNSHSWVEDCHRDFTLGDHILCLCIASEGNLPKTNNWYFVLLMKWEKVITVLLVWNDKVSYAYFSLCIFFWSNRKNHN